MRQAIFAGVLALVPLCASAEVNPTHENTARYEE